MATWWPLKTPTATRSKNEQHKIDLDMDTDTNLNDQFNGHVDQTPDGEQIIPGRNGGSLTPWRPGQSGNPDGKKKGTIHFSTIMRRFLAEQMQVSVNGEVFLMSRADALMLEKLRLATNSEFDAIRLRAIMDIEDRIDGKPIPVLPAPPEGSDDGVIFYIPNQHSRRREI